MTGRMKVNNMNEAYRKNVVLSMDMIASCINNEDFFDIWLECGVADGDIPVGAKGEDYSSPLLCDIGGEQFGR